MSDLKRIKWSAPATATTSDQKATLCCAKDSEILASMDKNLRLFSPEDSLFALMGAFIKLEDPFTRHTLAVRICEETRTAPELLALHALVQMPACTRSLRDSAKDDATLIKIYVGAAETVTQRLAQSRPHKAPALFDSFIGPLFDQKKQALPSLLEDWALACFQGCVRAGQEGAKAETVAPAEWNWINRLTVVNPALGYHLRDCAPLS